MKAFSDLTEQEILALAISSEEDDSRTYLTFAHELMDKFPASAKVFVEMAEEEQAHRRSLTDAYQKKFGGTTSGASCATRRSGSPGK